MEYYLCYYKNQSLKNLFFLLTFISVFSSRATHIVGGEINAQHITGTKYLLSLILYFDKKNGDIGAKDTLIEVSAYSERTKELIESFSLPLIYDSLLLYSNPKCDNQRVVTSKLLYQAEVNLAKNNYKAEQGYFFISDLCCRNHVVNNLLNPNTTGMSFYLKMPPLDNNAPVFSPLISDYACLNKNFRFSFSASDADGDSLVYHLVNPLAGLSSSDYPKHLPYNVYPKLVNASWNNGYSLNQISQGAIPLNINNETGDLLINTSIIGIYAIAVQCEEYRNQQKIGEVRREFQLPVYECPITIGPQIVIDTQNISIKYDTIQYYSGSIYCDYILVIDTVVPNNITLNANYNQTNISPKAFDFSPVVYAVNNDTDTLSKYFCIKGYLFPRIHPYLFEIVAKDEACPNANIDVLKLYVNVIDTLKKPKIELKNPTDSVIESKPNIPIVIEVKLDTTKSGQIICKPTVTSSIPNSAKDDAILTVENDKVTLTWLPSCKSISDTIHSFKIFYENRDCQTPYSDSVEVKISIKDYDIIQNKLIPNIITPNNDLKNDHFSVKDFLKNKCEGEFKKISFYNRFGTLIFTTSDINYEWQAENIDDRLYYFLIETDKKSFKGTLTIVR